MRTHERNPTASNPSRLTLCAALVIAGACGPKMPAMPSECAFCVADGGMPMDQKGPMHPMPMERAHGADGAHGAAARRAQREHAPGRVCPRCGAEMRIVAFIAETAAVEHILDHIGEPTEPPRITRHAGRPRGMTRSSMRRPAIRAARRPLRVGRSRPRNSGPPNAHRFAERRFSPCPARLASSPTALRRLPRALH